jgi:hypothetical protein
MSQTHQTDVSCANVRRPSLFSILPRDSSNSKLLKSNCVLPILLKGQQNKKEVESKTAAWMKSGKKAVI